MGYINIFISNKSKLSINNNQLSIETDSKHLYPLEDINSIVIESMECVITSYALQDLINNNVAVFLCNKQHMPNGVVLPINNFYRPLKILKKQIEMSKPLKKQIWQKIVSQKIFNQSLCLKYCEKKESNRLIELSNSVLSGDASNCEATAAAIYFKALFGNDFIRHSSCIINAILDYGYSLLRGMIARTLVAYGLNPTMGIFHKNELNGFNLADDIIEPFRPVVDLLAFELKDEEQLSSDVKKRIFSITSKEIEINKQKYSLPYAIEIMVQSVKRSIEDNKLDIMLPFLLKDGSLHKYE